MGLLVGVDRVWDKGYYTAITETYVSRVARCVVIDNIGLTRVAWHLLCSAYVDRAGDGGP